MNVPQYLVDAAQDPSGDFEMFIIKGTHPPQWIFDPEMRNRGAGITGAGLAQSNPEFYQWNIIRRIVASHGAISDAQYSMLIKEVEQYKGEPTPWFLACQQFVNENKDSI